MLKILSSLFLSAYKFVAITDKQFSKFCVCIQNRNKQADSKICCENLRLLIGPLPGSEQNRMVLIININMNKSVESPVDFERCYEIPFHLGAIAKAAPIFYMR